MDPGSERDSSLWQKWGQAHFPIINTNKMGPDPEPSDFCHRQPN
jgi:hypothetical protein